MWLFVIIGEATAARAQQKVHLEWNAFYSISHAEAYGLTTTFANTVDRDSLVTLCVTPLR